MSGDEGGKQRKAVRFPSNLEQLARVESTTSLESSDAPLTDSLPLPVATTVNERGVGKRSIVIMLAVNFLANVVFSIVIPSIWPFLNDLGVTDKSYLGWAIACNSAGTFIAAPLLGAWADKWQTRGVMLFTLVLMILANFCYSLADKVVFDTLTSNLAMLMTGRFLVGFAAGNFAVVQAYFSYATKPSQRLAVMSWNAGTTVIGFVVGPAIAAACHVDTTIFGGRVPINSWTLPGYLSAIAAILAVIAMFFVEDVPRPSAAALARESVSAAEIAAEKKARRDGERAALLGGGAGADAATRRASSLRSASGTARVETQRRAGSVANYGAWLFGGSGYYEQSIPAHKVAGPNADGDDRAKTWAGGFSLDRSASIVAYSSMNYGNAHGGSVLASNLPIPWAAVVVCLFLNFSITLTFTSLETIGPPYTESNPGLKWQEWQTGIYFMVLGFVCIVSLVLLQFLVKLLSDRAILPLMCLMMSVGYSLNFNLHDGVYPPVWCFYLSSALTSMGYAAGTAVLLAIFSKVLEGLDQGMFMGAFSAACSTARIAGPLVSSYVLQLDPQARWVFGGVAIALLVSALVSLASFRLLKPRCEEQAEAGEEGGVVVTAAAAEGGEFDAAPVVHSPSRARIN